MASAGPASPDRIDLGVPGATLLLQIAVCQKSNYAERVIATGARTRHT
jgi:hypothetical protein